MSEVCPICDDGVLTECTIYEKSIYKGKEALTALCYSTCSSCGSDQAGPAQTKQNKQAMQQFKAWVDRL